MIAKLITTDPGSSPSGVTWLESSTPSVLHIASVRPDTSSAYRARSPSYGTAPMVSSGDTVSSPVTMPAHSSWLFNAWLAKRRTVQGSQFETISIWSSCRTTTWSCSARIAKSRLASCSVEC